MFGFDITDEINKASEPMITRLDRIIELMEQIERNTQS